MKDYYSGSSSSSSISSNSSSRTAATTSTNVKGKGIDRLGGSGGGGMGGSVSESTVVMTPPTGSPGTSDEEWEVETGQHGPGAKDLSNSSSSSAAGLNGEVLRDGMDRWRKRMGGKAVVWGLGWVLSVIGLWGDSL